MPRESYNIKENIVLTNKQENLKQQYLNQLNLFALEPRNYIQSKNLIKTKNFIKSELESYGYKVNLLDYGQQKFTNIEVIIDSKNNNSESIILGAHYDTDEHSPGANDNGSSVVVLLELAKRLKNQDLKYNFRIVFFTNEEPPYFRTNEMGSTVYINNLIKNNIKIKAGYVFDTIGYYFDEPKTQHYPFFLAPFFPDTANFVAFIGNLSSRDLVRNSIDAFRKNAKFPSEGISAPAHIRGIDFSDHLSFYNHSIPALMITDTAFFRSSTYHQITDTPEKINFNKLVILTDELENMFYELYK